MSAAVKTAVPTATKNIMNYLAAPARVASKMDWKKRGVLSVDIGRDRIGLAVAPHPSSNQPIRTLEPLTVELETRQGNRRVLSKACINSMASIVQEHQVCALVVSWPVQHEGGRCGKPCGQVLHTLDSLLAESNDIVTKTRPVCLWDDRHVKATSCDYFGRDPSYGNCTARKNKTVHLASQEQYQHHDCSSTVAAKVWQDFCQSHWQPQQQSPLQSIVEYNNNNSDDSRIQQVEDDFMPSDDDEGELKLACM